MKSFQPPSSLPRRGRPSREREEVVREVEPSLHRGEVCLPPRHCHCLGHATKQEHESRAKLKPLSGGPTVGVLWGPPPSSRGFLQPKSEIQRRDGGSGSCRLPTDCPARGERRKATALLFFMEMSVTAFPSSFLLLPACKPAFLGRQPHCPFATPMSQPAHCWPELEFSHSHHPQPHCLLPSPVTACSNRGQSA